MKVPEFISCGATGYFFIYSFNPGYLSKGDSLVLWVEGGVGPFQWSVTGSDFTFTYADGQYAIIQASLTVPQDTTETVTVTDSCGTSVTGTVCACDADATPCCDSLPPILFDADNPEIFEAGEIVTLEISGGCPPYKWETLPASPNDYHFEAKYTNEPKNDLHAVTANKAFSIRIIDSCGTQFGPDEFLISNAFIVIEDLDDVGGARWFGGYSACSDPGYSPPYWSLDNPTELDAGDCDFFSIADGLPLFIFWPEGEGYLPTTEGTALSIITFARTITLCSDPDDTTYIGFGVMDICGNTDLGEADILICCDEGGHDELEFDSDATSDTIVKSTTTPVYFKGGCSPYEWSVSGTGFTLENSTTTGLSNTLIAGSTACGTATITCTDKCGHTADGEVRCTSGSWTLRTTVSVDHISYGGCTSHPENQVVEIGYNHWTMSMECMSSSCLPNLHWHEGSSYPYPPSQPAGYASSEYCYGLCGSGCSCAPDGYNLWQWVC